jgi:hypothetical protein
MIKYIFKLLVFDFGYSFFMGLIVLIPSLLLIPFIKENEEKQNPILLAIGFLIGGFLILGQAFIISRATEISLLVDPSRSHFLWYLIGFCFSTPIALVKGQSQNKYNWIGIPLAHVFYLIGVFSDFDNIEIVNRISKYLSV